MCRLVIEDGNHRQHRQRLKGLCDGTEGTVRIASAYVTDRDLLACMKNRDIRLLTSLLPMDIASGATSLEVLRVLIESGVECRYLREHPRLHAKVYIFGGVSAVVTSANLTGSAFDSNIEVGVEVDGSDVQNLTEWFDRFWEKAYPLTASQAANLEEQTAVLRHDYRELKRKTDIQLPLQKEPLSSSAVLNELRDLLEHARQFFVCNTNRNERIPASDGRDSALEQEMHNRGYAVAWYRFNYDSHMKRVKPRDAIFMFAVGGVGIIGIGRAKTECEKPLAWGHPDRIDKRLRKKHEPEWRVPVQWLAWCDDKDAYGWTGITGTFRDVTDDKYKDKREGAIKHFRGGFRGGLLGPDLKLSFKEGDFLLTIGPVGGFGPLGPRHRGVYRFQDTDGEAWPGPGRAWTTVLLPVFRAQANRRAPLAALRRSRRV